MMNGQKTTKAYGQEAAVLEAFDGKNRKRWTPTPRRRPTAPLWGRR
ncbi:MAG: hypothetical protein ACLU9S_24235 [Oscillospiraceae bacterium]